MRSPGSTFDLRAALSDEVRGALAALEDGGGEKAIHACRVRLKRARSLARVGHAFAPGLSAVFNDSTRAIMHSLADTRNLAALAKTSRILAKRSKRRAAAGLKAANQALEAAREAAAPLDLEAVNAGLRDLLALAQVWPEASPRQVRRGARRLVRRARKTWRQGSKKDAPEKQRHLWRQRESDRLHAAALLDDAWPRRRRRRQSERLVSFLGREHDVMLLTQRLKANPAIAGDVAGASAALKVLRKRQRRLAKRARRTAARLHEGRA
ncbi:MAG: CHAD domain-containing protein [Vitreimonas sp.]